MLGWITQRNPNVPGSPKTRSKVIFPLIVFESNIPSVEVTVWPHPSRFSHITFVPFFTLISDSEKTEPFIVVVLLITSGVGMGSGTTVGLGVGVTAVSAGVGSAVEAGGGSSVDVGSLTVVEVGLSAFGVCSTVDERAGVGVTVMLSDSLSLSTTAVPAFEATVGRATGCDLCTPLVLDTFVGFFTAVGAAERSRVETASLVDRFSGDGARVETASLVGCLAGVGACV